MARSKQITVYSFDELSDTAKEHARQQYAQLGYNWADESLDSLKALAKHFGGKLSNWSIDFFNSSPSSATFEMPEMEVEEIKSLLDELGSFNPDTLRGNGDCKLTGYCADEAAIDGFRKAFMRYGITDLTELMDEAFSTWLKEAQSDCEYQFSDEATSEASVANNWEYDVNGDLA